MKAFKTWFLVILGILGYKIKYINKYYKGRYISINYQYKARWYSPIFWFYCLIILIPIVFNYGFIQYFKSISDSLKYNNVTEWCEFYMQRPYKGLRRKLIILKKIYK